MSKTPNKPTCTFCGREMLFPSHGQTASNALGFATKRPESRIPALEHLVDERGLEPPTSSLRTMGKIS